MSKTWTMFLGVAIIMMVMVMFYEFYISLTGGNVTFSKTVAPITSNLGTTNLATFEQNFSTILIKTEYLDDK